MGRYANGVVSIEKPRTFADKCRGTGFDVQRHRGLIGGGRRVRVCVRVCACMRTRVRVRVRVWAVCGWRSKNGNQTAKISTKTLGGVRQRDAKGTTLSFSTQWQRTTEAEWWQTSQKVAYERRRQRGPELIGRHPHVGKLHETTKQQQQQQQQNNRRESGVTSDCKHQASPISMR